MSLWMAIYSIVGQNICQESYMFGDKIVFIYWKHLYSKYCFGGYIMFIILLNIRHRHIAPGSVVINLADTHDHSVCTLNKCPTCWHKHALFMYSVNGTTSCWCPNEYVCMYVCMHLCVRACVRGQHHNTSFWMSKVLFWLWFIHVVHFKLCVYHCHSGIVSFHIFVD